MADELLQKVRKDVDVLSLDVFDTLLLRNNKPEALRYYEISVEAAARLGERAGQKACSALDFCVARYMAMELSYRARPELDTCREGHIDEVLRSELRQLGLSNDLLPELKEIEIDYESRNLSPNLVLVDVCRAFKEAGGDVILVSDMYLDGEAIRRIAVDVLGDSDVVGRVFSSADTVLSKRSGKVFRLIEESLDQPADAFFHIGDNRVADVVKPKQAGWRALHFPVAEAELDARAASLRAFNASMAEQAIRFDRWAKV